jgi:signal transduction histidine kinase
MKKEILFKSLFIGLIPILILSYVYQNFFLSFTNENLDKVLSQELKFTQRDVSRFIQERVNNIKSISELSAPRVSLEFERPEGAARMLNSMIERYPEFNHIYLTQKDYTYFSSEGLGYEEAQSKLQQIKDLFSQSRENIVYKVSDGLFTGMHIREPVFSQDEVVGHLIADVNVEYLNQFLKNATSRLGNLKLKNVDFTFSDNAIDSATCWAIIGQHSLTTHVCYQKNENMFSHKTSKMVLINIFLVILIALMNFFLNKRLLESIVDPITSIILRFKNLSRGKYIADNNRSDYEEINKLSDMANDIALKLNDYQKVQQEKATIKMKNKLSAQVAHDIQSPLTALKMLSQDVCELPENKRHFLRNAVNRIEDIVTSLQTNLKANKENKNDEVYLLSSLLEAIVAEKRVEYRSKMNVIIEAKLDKNSYGLFSKFNYNNLARSLSNIINNSVESLIGNKGYIHISLDSDENYHQIKIIDNGRGIPKHMISKIGQRGLSFNKSKGSGLGLNFAIETLRKNKGKLNIKSIEGKGTQITISLPKVSVPQGFADKIIINKKRVVVIDDDSSIHHIWDERLTCYDCEVIHLSSLSEFEKYMNNNLFQKAIYFFDYEFLGEEYNGLEMIERYALSKDSYLVTSHIVDENVRKDAIKLGVKIVPKINAPFVPIENMCCRKIVLLDDDELVRMSWEHKANQKDIEIQAYANPSNLVNELDKYSKSTIFYIDQNLKDELNGVDVCKSLKSRGYENLYLATGEDQDNFKDDEAIKKVVGKAPPF